MNTEVTKILYSEPDENYGLLVVEQLEKHGFVVEWVKDGDKAAKRLGMRQYSLWLTEEDLPIKSALEIAQELRNLDSELPIVVLTKEKKKEDIIKGYKSGVDNYLLKPISIDIVICVIDRLLWRVNLKNNNQKQYYQIGKFKLDSYNQTLEYNGVADKLSPRESELLTLLAQHESQIVEHNTILYKIWRSNDYFNIRSLNVFINHLRHRLVADSDVKILSVHGKGYKLVVSKKEG